MVNLTPQQKGEFTHLAGEYYTLACLNRKRMTALLTIGNHKAIDILVHTRDGSLKTVDVKAIVKAPFYLGVKKNGIEVKPNHYYVCIFFGKDELFYDTKALPRVWIIPSKKFASMLDRDSQGGLGVNPGDIPDKFEDAWEQLR